MPAVTPCNLFVSRCVRGSFRPVASRTAARAVLAAWVSLPPAALGALQDPPPAPASQSAALVTAENFRATPNGPIIAHLMVGTRVAVVRAEGAWFEVELEGAVWLESLGAAGQGGYSLRVSAPEGENLRERPRGKVLAWLRAGALLTETGREPGWALVKRRGYLWSASVALDANGADRVVGSGREGTALMAAPGGDTLALVSPGAALVLGGRRGGWVRARIDGWAWLPPGSLPRPGADEGSGPTPEEFSAAPEAFVGHTVTWELRFIAAQLSSAAQPDFLEGETYLICRWGSDNNFVYVALPPDQLELATGLAPLESITVTGRVRTGASTLTRTPVIDLLAFERGRNRH